MIDSSNTRKIIEILRALGDDRKIIVNPIEALSGYKNQALAALVETRYEIRIYIDFSYPNYQQEASYIHELLHVLCTLEGYPNVILNKRYKKIIGSRNLDLAEGLRNDLWTAIQHPYVYTKEINDYDLKIDEVFNEIVNQKNVDSIIENLKQMISN